VLPFGFDKRIADLVSKCKGKDRTPIDDRRSGDFVFVAPADTPQ